MFTQACLIRDYNRDLISKIENIGYRNYGNPFQFTDFSILHTTIDGYYVPYRVQVDSSWIDCGTNEELFLAISDLRDDSDRFQWFIDPCGYWHFNPTSLDGLRKATVSELIEHFKK